MNWKTYFKGVSIVADVKLGEATLWLPFVGEFLSYYFINRGLQKYYKLKSDNPPRGEKQ